MIEPLVVHEREWIEDPAERFPWEAIEEASRRGFKTMGVPAAHGGGGASKLEIALVIEELAAGDMSIAVIVDQCIKISKFIDALATDEQKQWIFPAFVEDPRFLLAIGSNEPEHATDRQTSRRAEELGVGPFSSTPPRRSGRPAPGSSMGSRSCHRSRRLPS